MISLLSMVTFMVVLQIQNTLTTADQKYCIGPLSSKSSAFPHKLNKLEFIEVLEAMAKKIACLGEGASIISRACTCSVNILKNLGDDIDPKISTNCLVNRSVGFLCGS